MNKTTMLKLFYVKWLIDNGCVIFFFGNKLFLETHEDNMKFVILFLTEKSTRMSAKMKYPPELQLFANLEDNSRACTID